MADGLAYTPVEGTIEWALRRIEGHVTSLRGRWAPMAELVTDALKTMSREQRTLCVQRMTSTEDMPTVLRLRTWAGARARRDVPAQEQLPASGGERLRWSDPRAKAAFLRGFNAGRRDVGLTPARSPSEAIAMMDARFGDMGRIAAAPDTRSVSEQLADEAFDPFGEG